ncbi:MAG: hypothetical protein SNJ77_02595 [Cytophagales bacterium]
MKKISLFGILSVLGSVFLASCKTNQPMFAQAVTSGWILLGVSLVLLVIVLKKYI